MTKFFKFRQSHISVIFALIFAAMPLSGYCWKNAKYMSATKPFVKITYSTLIDNKICASENDCKEKGVFFINHESAGVKIFFYGVENEQLKEKLTIYCIQLYKESKMEEMTITFRKQSKKNYQKGTREMVIAITKTD